MVSSGIQVLFHVLLGNFFNDSILGNTSVNHPENTARIPPGVLTLLLSVILAGLPPKIPAVIQTKFLSGVQ